MSTRKRIDRMAGCLGALLLLSCAPRPQGEEASGLRSLDGCEELAALVREGLLEEMNRKIDRELEDYLARQRRFFPGYDPPPAGAPLPPGGSTWTCADVSKCTRADSSASTVSGTNNQVAAVDEADFVKNDDRYVYLLSGGALRIFDAWPPSQAHEVGKLPLEGTPLKLFVHGNRALVYSSLGQGRRAECTYGYDCAFTGDGKPTLIQIIDLRVRSLPRLVRLLRLSGSYVNARRVGPIVHTVISSPEFSISKLRTYPEELGTYPTIGPLATEFARVAFESLRRRNAEIIAALPDEMFRPSIEDRVIGTGPFSTDIQDRCPRFYRTAAGDGRAFTSLLSLDMSSETPAQATTIVSRPGATYATPDALYLAVRHGGTDSSGERTSIHKLAFRPSPPLASFAGSGEVKGRVLNQFSMDEHEGNLRVATTTEVLGSRAHNTVTILGPEGPKLAALGSVDNLAPGEDIRSVRFDGPRGYLVTFKKTDPLFVLDLADPRRPRVEGELKIPGFSTYMHRLDSNHLLTIGLDAQDQGSFAWFAGVMLQIFDATKPTQPELLHKEVIGTRGSASDAVTDHLAFNYFPPKKVLAVPMTICEGGDGGLPGTQTFSGLLVYDVTLESGFKLRGKIPHPTSSASNACAYWWTGSRSEVKRSIIMDDFVLSISSGLLKVNSLLDLSSELRTIKLD